MSWVLHWSLMSSPNILQSLLLLCIVSSLNSSSPYTTSSTTNSSSTNLDSHFSSIRFFCKSTPYPDVCFDSLKLSISINITPNIITYLLQSLQTALTEAGNLSNLLSSVGTSSKIIEKQRGAIQDCKDLHQSTMASLKKSVSRINSAPDTQKMADAGAFLTAALTNKNTCLEGLDSASGPMKPTLVNSVISTYKHISNCLSMLPEPASKGGHTNRRLLGFPKWLSRKDRRILQDTSGSGDEYDPSGVLEVATDGSGNFTTITDAINFTPNNSNERVIIYVREGVYEENVDIPSYKPNIVLLGDGSDVTVITGNRSVADGWTTFRSATVGKVQTTFEFPFFFFFLLANGSTKSFTGFHIAPALCLLEKWN